MTYFDFRNMMLDLQNMGVLDVLLPFVLIFTIIFAVLQKSKILGVDENKKPRKNFNVVIALVMALAVVIPHVTGMYPHDRSVVDIINNALPQVALLAVAIIMVLLTIGVFGREFDAGQGFGGIVVTLSVLLVGFIFAASAGWFDRTYLPRWMWFIYDPQFQALIVTIVVFGLIIYFITKEEKQPKGDSFADKLNKMFKEIK